MLQIKHSLRAIAVGFVLAGAATQALAVDVAFRPRIETGVQYYQLHKFSGSGRTAVGDDNYTSSQTFESWMPMLRGGVTVFADRFFADVSVQGSYNGSDTDDLTNVITNPSTGGSLTRQFRGDADFDRTEYALSVGYTFHDNWGAYGGWKWANTEIDQRLSGTQTFVQGGASVPQSVIPESGKFEFNFKYNGPFVGGFYAWTVDSGPITGSLVANAAVAFLSGETGNVKYTDRVVGGVPLADASLPNDFTGDTVGLTLGLTWNGTTNVEGLTYSFGVDAYQYNFDANRSDQGVSDFRETVANIRVGVAYTF